MGRNFLNARKQYFWKRGIKEYESADTTDEILHTFRLTRSTISQILPRDSQETVACLGARRYENHQEVISAVAIFTVNVEWDG